MVQTSGGWSVLEPTAEEEEARIAHEILEAVSSAAEAGPTHYGGTGHFAKPPDGQDLGGKIVFVDVVCIEGEVYTVVWKEGTEISPGGGITTWIELHPQGMEC